MQFGPGVVLREARFACGGSTCDLRNTMGITSRGKWEAVEEYQCTYYRPKKSSDVGLTNEANNVARFFFTDSTHGVWQQEGASLQLPKSYLKCLFFLSNT